MTVKVDVDLGGVGSLTLEGERPGIVTLSVHEETYCESEECCGCGNASVSLDKDEVEALIVALSLWSRGANKK